MSWYPSKSCSKQCAYIIVCSFHFSDLLFSVLRTAQIATDTLHQWWITTSTASHQWKIRPPFLPGTLQSEITPIPNVYFKKKNTALLLFKGHKMKTYQD